MSEAASRGEAVEVLAVDWKRLRRTVGGTDVQLANDVIARGRKTVAEGPPPIRVDPTLTGEGRRTALRRAFVWQAAAVAVHRQTYATRREWFRGAERTEQRRHEQKLELDKDVIPPLKEEAKALRAEIRRLEAELREAGVGPDSIEPRIDWSNTLSVDAYRRPEYETRESRKAKTIEFFRRLG